MVTTAMSVPPLVPPRHRVCDASAPLYGCVSTGRDPDAHTCTARLKVPIWTGSPTRPRHTPAAGCGGWACEVNPNVRIASSSVVESGPTANPWRQPRVTKRSHSLVCGEDRRVHRGMPRGPRFSTACQTGSQRVTDRIDRLPGSMSPRDAHRMTTLRSRSLSIAGLTMLAATSPALWAAAAAAPGPAQAGREWVWPLEPAPRIVRAFEPPASRWGPGHRGVDLLGAAGQPVLAIGSGSVRFAGAVAGRGVVVISHGALQSTYEPVTAAVHRGERVRAGEVVGLLQTVHSHCSPEVCLHLGLRHGSVYIDPLSVLSPRQVRLLPLTPTDRQSSSGFPDGPHPTDSAPAQMTSAVSGRAGIRKHRAVRAALTLAAVATVASGVFVLVRDHARG
jgi:hypothetical protein